MRKIFTVVLSLLFVLGADFNASAQKAGIKKVSFLYINTPDQNLKFEVLNKKVSFSPSEKLNYTWYHANAIHTSQGGYDGKLLHGRFIAFYLSNNLKESGRYHRGLKTGKWSAWSESGKLKETGSWMYGMKNGRFRYYNENGELIKEENYRNNKLHGKYREFDKGKTVVGKKYRAGSEVAADTLKTASPKIRTKSTAGTTEKKSFFQKVKSIFKGGEKGDKEKNEEATKKENGNREADKKRDGKVRKNVDTKKKEAGKTKPPVN